MVWREYRVSVRAIAQAFQLGLKGNVAKRVAGMARSSAVLTHPKANRRFEDFMLKTEGDLVVSIMKFEPAKRLSQRAHAKDQ